MGRGRKFTKLVMEEDENEMPSQTVDDYEPAAVGAEAEARSCDYNSELGPEGDDAVGAIKDAGGSILRADSTERGRERADSTERASPRSTDQAEIEPEPAAANATPPRPVEQQRPWEQQQPCDSRPLEELGLHWQELAAEAAGLEIEAMHLDQAGSTSSAAECYRQVAVKLLQAAEGLKQGLAVRQTLEHRAADAMERGAALEAIQASPGGARDKPPLNKAKLETQGILASTLAASVSSPEPEEMGRKAALPREEAKIFGTAAAIGGAAGLLLAGPLSAAALGAAAAYSTTREDTVGVTARKVCTTSIGMADCAMNKAVDTSLKAADFGLEEGRRRLLDAASGPAPPQPSKVQAFCRTHKDKCIRAAVAVEALQGALPRRQLTEEARRMRARYPDRVPVLCERASRSDLPELERKKFAVPGSMLCGEFKYIIHKQVAQASRGLDVDQTIYVFVGGASPKTSATMAELFEQHGSEDGFLYVCYCAENTLGRR